MIDEIQRLIDKYTHWLKEKMSLREVDGDWVEITTPYIDRHNDYLQIYARRENGGFHLSDDGYILNDLEQSGCEIRTPKRERLLEITLNGFGVKRNGSELSVLASADNFSLKKHSLLQAMLAVNDLFYLSQAHVSSLFLEDVAAWLNLHDIRYNANILLPGKTGFTYQFDFMIPHSKSMPERIIKTINKPGKETTQNLVLSWIDTKDNRPEEAIAFAFLNDIEKPVQSDIIDALKNYNVTPVLWSEKEKVREKLAA